MPSASVSRLQPRVRVAVEDSAAGDEAVGAGEVCFALGAFGSFALEWIGDAVAPVTRKIESGAVVGSGKYIHSCWSGVSQSGLYT